MIKEIKYGGYTATPSDYECPDGDLAAVLNLVPEDDTLKPVFPPSMLMQIPDGYKLLFTHRTEHIYNLILHNTTSGELCYIDFHDATRTLHDIDFTADGIRNVDAIGNTLLVISDSGMFYLLWQQGQYDNLGNHLPECAIQFSLHGPVTYTSDEFTVEGDKAFRDLGELSKDIEVCAQVRNAIMAAANQAVAKVTNAHYFCFPLFVRYAYRLYDGSLTMQSAPILLLPPGDSMTLSMGDNWPNAVSRGYNLPVTTTATAKGYAIKHEALYEQQLIALKKWADIIISVDVFISQQFYTYDQGSNSFRPVELPSKQVTDDIEGNHTFHLAASISIDDIYSGDNTAAAPAHIQTSDRTGNGRVRPSFYLDDGVIQLNFPTNNDNIVVRETLPDDYDSHDTLLPSDTYVFNSRLNLAGGMKMLFSGFDPRCFFSSPDYSTTVGTRFVVAIENENNDIVVQSVQVPVNFNAGTLLPWFYYPNIKAKVLYAITGNTVRAFPLKMHSTLMGAYYFGLNNNDDAVTVQDLPDISTDEQRRVSIGNKVYTSEADNPFFFPVMGINSVSNGTILAICAAVKALSMGQFGQFPLYAFTTEGVWALEVADNGTYKARQPVTRDVCTNTRSITQLDDAVLFATDRGIMLLSGSTSQCITDTVDTDEPFRITDLPGGSVLPALVGLDDDISPQPFRQFLGGCRMIYDYLHQRIIVYNADYPYAYVFSLKSKQWGMMRSDIDNHINAYPYAWAITHDNKLVNFSFEDVDNLVPGIIITRPLKLDLPNQLKTIDTVIQRGFFDYSDTTRAVKPVRTILYGSRDLFNWKVIYSSTDHYLRGFRGTPFKFFRVASLFRLRRGESIFGCTVQLTPRLTDQPR